MDIEIRYGGYFPTKGEYDDEILFQFEMDDKQNAVISSGKKKKKIDSKIINDYAQKLLSLNFCNIFQEMNMNQGFDGDWVDVKIEDCSNKIELNLWMPDIARYRDAGWDESAECYSTIQELFKIAREQGFIVRAVL